MVLIVLRRGPRVETRGPLKYAVPSTPSLEPEVRAVDRTVVQFHYELSTGTRSRMDRSSTGSYIDPLSDRN